MIYVATALCLTAERGTYSDISLVHGIEIVHVLEVDCGTRNPC